MRQRRQFYAIARVGERYRTIAAIHSQWLMELSAVRQYLVTLKILRAPRNFPAIRRELKLAASKPADFWNPCSRGDRSEWGIDFPFMTTALLLGSDVRPPSHALSPAHPLPIDTPPDQIQNGDGISIFDITEIGRPRYAMMRCVAKRPCDRHDGLCHSRSIMNASDYIRRYRAEDEIYDDANDHSDGPGCSNHGPALGNPVAEHFPDEVRELDAFPLVRCCDLDSV
ncbi:hypothetical protein WHR41_04554 [Cladosporium halotolerans]|uniref:Uncharacterized protein n=1 Tax=Cladosporium halotolerans TaxID=1052096 RepID=A0AB34KNN5_9PEZI